MSEYPKYGALALLVFFLIIALVLGYPKRSPQVDVPEVDKEPAPQPPTPAPAPDVADPLTAHLEEFARTCYTTKSGYIPEIRVFEGPTPRDLDMRGVWTVEDFQVKKRKIATALAQFGDDEICVIADTVNQLARTALTPKNTHDGPTIDGPLYIATGNEPVAIKDISTRQQRTNQSEWPTTHSSNVALGLKGIYGQHTTTHMGYVKQRILIDEDVADVIFGQVSFHRRQRHQSLYFITGYDEVLKSPFIETECVQEKITESQGVQLIWPIESLTSDIFDEFLEMVDHSPNAALTVSVAKGYTHVKLESANEVLLLSDRSSYFNSSIPESRTSENLGRQLLDQFGGSISEPTCKVISPYTGRVIRWYINPILNEVG